MPHDVTQVAWRTLRLPWFVGPGERFSYGGIVWEVQRVVDREGSTNEPGGSATIVVVSPLTDEPSGQDPAGIVDLGAVQESSLALPPALGDTPAGPTAVAPTTPSGPTPVVPELGFLNDPRFVNIDAPGAAPTNLNLIVGDNPTLAELQALQIELINQKLTLPTDGSGEIQRQAIDGLLNDIALLMQQRFPGETGGQGFDPANQAQVDLNRDIFEEQTAQFQQQFDLTVEQFENAKLEFAKNLANAAAIRQQDNLNEALRLMGFIAPSIQGITDPAEFRQALLDALEDGTLVPTLDRLNLVAEAASRPSDIIRLLFLSGGQKPPARRLGQFNFNSILEQGAQARDDLATQVAATPSTTMQQLIDQFMNAGSATPAAVPQAYRGAVIPMRKTNGVYRAEHGASVVEGPTLFTVGEKGTEFALLAPGSIIAPKLSKAEPETQDQAAKAVMEMLMFGERQKPKAAKKGAYVKPKQAKHGVNIGPRQDSATEVAQGTGRAALLPLLRMFLQQQQSRGRPPLQAALDGTEVIGPGPGPITVDELPQFTLESILEGASGLGAALGGPSNVSEQISNMSLQPFLVQGYTPEERATIIGDVLRGDDENQKRALQIGIPTISPEMQQAQKSAIQGAFSKLQAGTLTSQDANQAAQAGFFGLRDLILQFTNGQVDRAAMLGELSRLFNDTQQQINAAVSTGAPGQQLPFAKLNSMGAEAQAAAIGELEALFGSQFIQNLLGLQRQLRQNAFGATSTVSGAPFQLSI